MENKSPETVKRLRQEGLTFEVIAQMLKIGRTTARDWFYDRHKPVQEKQNNTTGFVNQNLSRTKNIEKEDVYEFLENLSPIKCNVSKNSNVNKTKSDYCLIIGDTHFPVQHRPTVDIFLETVRDCYRDWETDRKSVV